MDDLEDAGKGVDRHSGKVDLQVMKLSDGSSMSVGFFPVHIHLKLTDLALLYQLLHGQEVTIKPITDTRHYRKIASVSVRSLRH